MQVSTTVTALTLYDRGSYAEFSRALGATDSLDELFPRFERDASRWVNAAEPAARWRRTVVAASVALEIAHVLRREPPNRAARYLAWASLLMRAEPPAQPSEIERLWYLTSVAGMQELFFPMPLLVGSVGRDRLTTIAATLGPGGHLAAASSRVPDPGFSSRTSSRRNGRSR